jgi:hypothetical protein
MVGASPDFLGGHFARFHKAGIQKRLLLQAIKCHGSLIKMVV